MHRPPLQQNSFLALLVLVTLGFFVLLKPFYAPIFWACAVAVIFSPMQQRLLVRCASSLRLGLPFLFGCQLWPMPLRNTPAH